MFESTSDKILRVLIDNDSVLDISEVVFTSVLVKCEDEKF